MTSRPLREGRDGKCEGRNEKCEFLARESVSSSPMVQIFGKGKCKFIANFSATMVTSLPSLSLCISLSLSPKVPHAQYRKRFRASYNTVKGTLHLHSFTKMKALSCSVRPYQTLPSGFKSRVDRSPYFHSFMSTS